VEDLGQGPLSIKTYRRIEIVTKTIIKILIVLMILLVAKINIYSDFPYKDILTLFE